MADIAIWQDKIVLRTKEDLPISLIKFAKYNEKMKFNNL